MNTMHSQCTKRSRLLAITAASTLVFYSGLLAAETAATESATANAVAPEQPVAAENTEASGNTEAAEDSGPGEVGLSISGASAGITTEYFEQNTIDALIQSGIFSGVDQSGKARVVMRMLRVDGVFPSDSVIGDTPYYLSIRINNVDTPSFSIRMTVGMDAIWTLYRTDGKVKVLSENVHSTYTGSAFEGGIHGANRVHVAMNGAARENIRLGIELLKTIDLEAVGPVSPLLEAE